MQVLNAFIFFSGSWLKVKWNLMDESDFFFFLHCILFLFLNFRKIMQHANGWTFSFFFFFSNVNILEGKMVNIEIQHILIHMSVRYVSCCNILCFITFSLFMGRRTVVKIDQTLKLLKQDHFNVIRSEWCQCHKMWSACSLIYFFF